MPRKATTASIAAVTPVAASDSPLATAKAAKAKSTKKVAAPKKKPAAKVAKTAAPKAAAPTPKATKPIVVKPAAKTKTKAAKPISSPIFLEKDTYKALIDGLMDQGIEHGDAVDTLKVGLRQANGIPVPMALMMQAA